MKIDVTQPLTYNNQEARYVGVGVPDWPIVAEICKVTGGTCIQQFSADGKSRDKSGNLSFIERVEPEDWS